MKGMTMARAQDGRCQNSSCRAFGQLWQTIDGRRICYDCFYKEYGYYPKD